MYTYVYTHIHYLLSKGCKDVRLHAFFSIAPPEKDCGAPFIFYDLHGINSATRKQKHTVIPFINKSKQITQQGIIKKQILKSK